MAAPRRSAVRVALLALLLGVALVPAAAGDRSEASTQTVVPAARAGEPVQAAAVSSPKLGVFRGTSRSEIQNFATWLGREPDYVADFKPSTTWQDIAAPQYLDEWKGSPYRLVYAVPLLPDSGGTMVKGATGSYDKYFTQLGRHLVSVGQANAILRVGWEFNILPAPWKTSNPKVFINYWRHVVNAMRSVKGQHFQFDWNPEDGNTMYDASLYYPGGQYVDYVGVDVYDATWQPGVYPYPAACAAWCRLSHQKAAWNYLANSDRGLKFWSAFARKVGKPMSFPEWGMWARPDGQGGGDDPYYLQMMYDFVTNPANHVAYQVYFDFNADNGEHRLMDSLPAGGALYRQLFGPH
jgi:hypothetical protein